MKEDFKTWKALSEALNVSQRYVCEERKKDGSPTTKNLKEWETHIARNRALGGRGSNQQGKKRSGEGITAHGKHYGADDIVTLKAKLIEEQGKHEGLKNRLKELEIERQEQNLVPRSVAQEAISKVLTPLRRSLDAMPKSIAHRANPVDALLAEQIIRDHINYIFRSVSGEEDLDID